MEADLKQASDEDIALLRRFLHQHPEVSGEEHATARQVTAWLQTCNPQQLLTQIGHPDGVQTGVLAVFDSGIAGPTVLFRCELDALPIQEINTFDYTSVTQGVSHKCGHDGHMSILLSLARSFAQQPPAAGKALLLFQPAEEDGRGAASVIRDERFKALHPDFVFAVHNLPGYPRHAVVLKENAFTSAVTSCIIRLHGTTSHAAEPELGKNPAMLIAAILQRMDGLSNNQPEREDFKLITPVHVTMGEKAYGISAGYGEIHLTLRTWTSRHLENLSDDIRIGIEELSAEAGIPCSFEWTHTFQANENNEEAMQYVRQAAAITGSHVMTRDYPFKWGEDFGLFTQLYKGAMFGIGSGEDCPALHNPDYDFPDEIAVPVAHLFRTIFDEIVKD
ncbi:MAG: hypothetical protein ABR95_08525 [Sphingobacteriales bacterium BACL12 MAG-120813-bin55]|jgi:amidohydrolase|nr:MAG: hypothetical protein ABR95_08525 [Sphingobacteriales bacterium BACL12 MAG-120813-bin55]